MQYAVFITQPGPKYVITNATITIVQFFVLLELAVNITHIIHPKVKVIEVTRAIRLTP